MRRFAVLSLLAFALAGCPGGNDAVCKGGPQPPLADASQYHGAPADAGFEAQGPFACGQAQAIRVTVDGGSPLEQSSDGGCDRASDAGCAQSLSFLDDLEANLTDAGIPLTGLGLAQCAADGGIEFGFSIDDWTAADTAVAITGSRLQAWNRSGPVDVLVQGITIACPDGSN